VILDALKNRTQLARNDRSGSSEITLSSHIDDRTVMLRTGDVARVWKVGGLSHVGMEADDIQIRHDSLNVLYRGLASTGNVSIWVHNIRRRITDRLDADYSNEFCNKLNAKYYDSFAGYRMMNNEIYLTVIYRPDTSTIIKKIKKTARSVDDIRTSLKDAKRIIKDIGNIVEASLKAYDIEALGVYEENGVKYSQIAELFAFLVNGVWQKMPLLKCPINSYIQTSRIFIGNEVIEYHFPEGNNLLAASLDIKGNDYPDITEPGHLNSLLYEEYEYVYTQSFSFMARPDAQKRLSDQQKRLLTAEDAAESQIDEISEALDDLISGRLSFGEYHSSLLIFGADHEILLKNVAAARATMTDLGIVTSRITFHLDCSYWAQLPGNWGRRPRVVPINTKNFAGLASFHNFATGKRNGNPWGSAVTILKTQNGQPYYFNFHASKEDEDNRDQKLLGNTKIIGMSGAGKTVLLGFLLSQAMKYNPTVCCFDKDRGTEILIRAIGGKYLAIENGVPTGFNPLQQEPTETNILFCESLVRKLASEGGCLGSA
jgi:type IV secretion system protein VirB4